MSKGFSLKRDYWYGNDKVADNLDTLRQVAEWHRALMDSVGLTHPIDEMAVAVPDMGDAANLIHRAVTADGVELFNMAIDDVRVVSHQTRYSVRYLFLNTPHGFRVEVMNISEGLSPLHHAILGEASKGVTFPVVHASFKVHRHDLEEVEDALGDIAYHVQRCESTYGVFSYWLPKDTDSLVYLKPRVNLRDGA